MKIFSVREITQDHFERVSANSFEAAALLYLADLPMRSQAEIEVVSALEDSHVMCVFRDGKLARVDR